MVLRSIECGGKVRRVIIFQTGEVCLRIIFIQSQAFFLYKTIFFQKGQRSFGGNGGGGCEGGDLQERDQHQDEGSFKTRIQKHPGTKTKEETQEKRIPREHAF